jgi:hypothetical protein
MKTVFTNAWISALLYGAIATAVPALTARAADAEQMSPPGAMNNRAVANRAAARSMASVMAESRANNSAQTPAEQMSSKANANANAAEVETTRQLNQQQQTIGATTP